METAIQYNQTAGRSGIIIALGVLSVLFMGPLTGVPGWIMATQDLRDVGRSFLPPSEQTPLRWGRALSILGTFFSPIWLFMYAVLAFVIIMMLMTMTVVIFS